MKTLPRLPFLLATTALLTAPAAAQVPDLLNALDAGGRAMAMGGANAATNVDTLSAYYNPAALAYLDSREIGLVYRNLPESTTRLAGDRSDPDSDTNGQGGGRSITHAGFASPVRDLLGRGSGTLAFAYTVGGYIDDKATATSLDDDPLTFVNYQLNRKAKSSFYTLSYGKALNSGLSYGVGLVYATQEIKYSETGIASDQSVVLDASGSSTGNGVGVIAGLLYTPASQPNWSLGLSYRSPINLSGNSETSDLYDEIPGRVIFGATYRREGFRGGKDYLLLGGQVQHFFGGDSSQFFERDPQTVFGFGAEYNLGIDSGRVPLRVGFTTVPNAGDGYGSRNAFTFGVGYRPNRYPVGIDLGYAVPEGGGYDFSIAASYRFK